MRRPILNFTRLASPMRRTAVFATLGILTPSGLAQPQFEERPFRMPDGSNTTAVALGDVDGDGDLPWTEAAYQVASASSPSVLSSSASV